MNVAVTQNCTLTSGNIATATRDGMFLCPARAELVDSQVKDASHFYVVHEYGLLAIRTNSDKLADCWAAHQLARAPTPAEIFSREFLPPRAERELTYTAN